MAIPQCGKKRLKENLYPHIYVIIIDYLCQERGPEVNSFRKMQKEGEIMSASVMTLTHKIQSTTFKYLYVDYKHCIHTDMRCRHIVHSFPGRKP